MRGRNRQPPPQLPVPLGIPAPTEKKAWWERLPVAIGISLSALVVSMAGWWINWYTLIRVKEEATVSIIRVGNFADKEDRLSFVTWLAIANQGTRHLVVVQSPLLVIPPNNRPQIIDGTPMSLQPAPLTVDPGKIALVQAVGWLRPADVGSLLVPAQRDPCCQRPSPSRRPRCFAPKRYL